MMILYNVIMRYSALSAISYRVCLSFRVAEFLVVKITVNCKEIKQSMNKLLLTSKMRQLQSGWFTWMPRLHSGQSFLAHGRLLLSLCLVVLIYAPSKM